MLSHIIQSQPNTNKQWYGHSSVLPRDLTGTVQGHFYLAFWRLPFFPFLSIIKIEHVLSKCRRR